LRSAGFAGAKLAPLGALCGALVACSPRASCDAPAAVEQLLTLSREGVIEDVAEQCARDLHNKIPEVTVACPANDQGSRAGCLKACTSWAQTAVEATDEGVQTLYADKTIATVSCRASVRFTVAYDGGQVVRATIPYLVASRNGALQVAVSR
jgi:hypothetical protein